jgi:hypothetical protein
MWELLSSDGWQRVEWHPKEVRRGDNALLAMELRLSGDFWDPLELVRTNTYILTPQYDCKLPAVMLKLSQLEVMIEGVAAWLEHRLCPDVTLSPERYQVLSFRLSPREDLISDQEHPICSVVYAAARHRCEWLMPVDEPCIRLFFEGIQRWHRAFLAGS